MEKMGVIRPDVTPQIDDAVEDKKAEDKIAGKAAQAEIQQLDSDFRKQAANQVTTQLHSR